ncbi:MAG: UbiA family prenyltransferase [Saprospiraceae bacterium]|nr:UbiA family prenyltransferase [Saprospiraceae bacterium]MDW8484013.1 UbiA family prenyltransferase [Saprospiraceae bacterium]
MKRRLRLVVIGSSTAAGQGADPPDQAWINRYREYLKAQHPRSEVINLAQGGLQTFHLLPTGHRPPPARPLPLPERNITKALAFRPDAIIVQVPSNDAAAYYGPAEQLANFDLIVRHAFSHGVPVWLCTPQPRNFSPEQRRIQRDLRQAMQARYGPILIDAWEALADANDGLIAACDSGDGAHLNNEGHARLFEAIVRANIPGVLKHAAHRRNYWIDRVPALAEWTVLPSNVSQLPLRSKLWAWCRLVRLPNLAITGLALALPYWDVVRPAIEHYGASPRLHLLHFTALVLTTLLIAAFGYVLNDLCDRKTDAINRPEKAVLGQFIAPQTAKHWVKVLWILAVALGGWLSLSLKNAWLLGVFTGSLLVLALYAQYFKCTALLGNVFIALLCGLVPLLGPIAEYPFSNGAMSSEAHQRVFVGVGAYSLFAFITNLWREQVKDLEDSTGDAVCNCRTLPVRVGISAAKKAALIPGFLLSALTGSAGWIRNAIGETTSTWSIYGGLPIGLASLGLTVFLSNSTGKRQFSAVSFGIKILMLAGLFWLWRLF